MKKSIKSFKKTGVKELTKELKHIKGGIKGKGYSRPKSTPAHVGFGHVTP